MAEHRKSVNKSKGGSKDDSANNEKTESLSKSLDQKAVEEILREIKLKSVRAKEIGPSGWLDVPVKRTNKRFLRNTLRAAVKHNTRKADKEKFQSEKKLLEMDYDQHPSRRPKFGDRKFIFKKPSRSKDCKHE